MSPYLRTVKTSSGATAVQIVHSSHRGSRDIERIGSAHDEVELELLKAAAAASGTIGLLTDHTGFPLMVAAFEGNKAETKTMLPVISASWPARPGRRDSGRRCGDGVGGESEGHRGRGLVVHPRSEDPERAVCDVAAAARHTRDSIEAHLTIVFAALAVSRWIEHATGWSIRKFVKTRPPLPHRPEIQAGDHVITAAHPLPGELRQAIEAINASR